MPKPKRVTDPVTGRPCTFEQVAAAEHQPGADPDTPERVFQVSSRKWRRVMAGKDYITGRRIA